MEAQELVLPSAIVATITRVHKNRDGSGTLEAATCYSCKDTEYNSIILFHSI